MSREFSAFYDVSSWKKTNNLYVFTGASLTWIDAMVTFWHWCFRINEIFVFFAIVRTQEYKDAIEKRKKSDLIEPLLSTKSFFPGPGVKCVLCFLLVLIPAPWVFLLVLCFSSIHKNQHPKFQFHLETVDKKSHLVECTLLNPISFLFH